jgi:bacteriophage CI repressor helix-turn-helix domain
MFNVLERITELRKARNWSVYKLAKLSGIPQSTIATWYSKNLYPPVDKIEMLCISFEISLAEFFVDSKNKADISSEFIYKFNLLPKNEQDIVIYIINNFIKQ